MGLHLHRAQHPLGLRPHTPRLRPPEGTERFGLSASTGPEFGPEARSPGVPLAQAPWEAATFYSRDTPALARPGLPSRLPEGSALGLGRPLRDRKKTALWHREPRSWHLEASDGWRVGELPGVEWRTTHC